MRAIYWTGGAMAVAMGLIFTPVAIAGNASDTINALSESRKADIFRQLLSSDGTQCGSVTKVFFKGEIEKDDSAAYAVRCEPGGDWVVTVKNGGNMQTRIVSCAVTKLFGVACWDPF